MSRSPQPIADVLAELLARRGYGRLVSAERLREAWRGAAGQQLAGQTRAGLVRRGVLEVICANSVLVQELTFQKAALVERLASALAEAKIRDLKFRVGPVQAAAP